MLTVGASRELAVSVVSLAERLFELNIGNSLNSAWHKSVWPGELGHDNATGLSIPESGRAHVCTPVTNAHLVCRLLIEKTKNQTNTPCTRTTQPHHDTTHSAQTSTYIKKST